LTCVSTAQQQLKHSSIINTIFHTNPKHSPIEATMKKLNSIPGKTSTLTDLPFQLDPNHK